MNIGDNISKAIKESKWLNVSYINKNNVETDFWMAVLDIEVVKKELYVYIFNRYKKTYDTITTWISFDKITSAEVLKFTTYDRPDKFITDIENNIEKYEWLNYDHFNNNVLNYYKECNELDKDPVQKEYTRIPGIDLKVLRNELEYVLSYEQFCTIVKDLYDNNKRDAKNKDNINFYKPYNTLIINRLSIDEGRRKYVVCYYELALDPRKKSLIILNQLQFNTSFMIEGRKHNITKYINMDVDEFVKNFESKQKEYEEIIRENLRYGEFINTRPDIMLLDRELAINLSYTFSVIEEKYKKKKLPIPLKCFFGNISKRNIKNKKEPLLVIYDERININQMSVLYNSLKFPVTYVKGPPGTGKTQTILNIIISGFYNNKTMLICSSNNKPVDGIVEKLKFEFKGKSIPFPYLRLGNYQKVDEAIEKILEFYEMETDDTITNDMLNSLRINDTNNHKQLHWLLNIQERRNEIQNSIECSYKLIQSFGNEDSYVINQVKEKIEKLKMELNQLPEICNDDLLKLYTPFKKNELASEYFYYRSLHCINKLKKPRYRSLIDICKSQGIDRNKQFNEWCMVDENMRKLNKVFPILFSTNISARLLGSPQYMFDLVIMDEAGQCNIATALIPITRAKSLVLVGDPNQLKPVIVLDENTNELLMNKYNITENFNYKTNSILDVMLANDNISKYILLSYHYRCGRKIIEFSNKRYYENKLDLSYVRTDGKLEILDVENGKENKYLNEAKNEASCIINYIKENNIHDAAIVTPFVNQEILLTKMLKKEGIRDIHCGTIHSLQGDEKDTIIFSLAISGKTRKRTFDWVKDNYELINVAVTRARSKLVIAGDTKAINCLSNKEDDVSNLVKYVKDNGETFIPPNKYVRLDYGRTNESQAENEFFSTISHFCTCYRKFKAERNVSLSTIIKEGATLPTDIEFDLVLYALIGDQPKPLIAFEINVGNHFGLASRKRSNRRKIDLCEKYNIKLVNIPTNFVKEYENIMELILSFES